ncbi:hypothetical protein H0O02_04560, partial [Candidatus Micrarchaeota archaeon]|nr:hypothetical protein [Candidatus Micrarchaeota archaeon]
MTILDVLLLTIIIEFFPVFFLMRKECSAARIAFAVVAVNLITNPVANCLYPEFPFWPVEAGVIIVEAALFALLFDADLKKGAMLSLAANAPTILLS